MHQTRTRRPFIVEIKSSRRTARRQEMASIWNGVDITAIDQAVIGEMTDNEMVVATAAVGIDQGNR
ncbi:MULTISPECIES: hypothetical protein [unclassified Rhizobium]|uniref:hypothetical protein n=1 Tax=unclassified Rhizobium TaxID=2613769 RepID=UPI001ADBEA9C|nr:MULTISPECIES: hypothetical protein [unclassified Rhizobium]MBO9101883.1 hypothetical protein [Rhizobium sp. L58/93]MBO9172054.1 hypothetical protein [Rhizobium sp. L245/93]QXZ88277.1 hypothetical protein J5287_30540 [Rhizobium sp. K1/93]QXZ94248.1 hypothetical protein J5280_31350 [Rhizobium sp. K15/93]QYA05662.1 hypothetical protein J5278_30570 [Rhizobium sp. B21/90]